MACLLFHLLIGLTILTNTSSQAENDFGSCSSKIELTIELREQHHEITNNVYCKSRTKPFDDSAEFQVDGFSREHILIINNRCFDRMKQECSFDYCECDPALNVFTVKFKMDHLTVGQTFGCLIRIRNDATGNFLKLFTSSLFNGTDFIPHECNVKVIGTTTDITNTTNNSSSPSDDIGNNTDSNFPIYLLISIVTVETIIIIWFVNKLCQRSGTEERSKTIEHEELLPTQDHTQTLLEKIKALETEINKQEEGNTDTPVLPGGGINAIQMELTATKTEYKQAQACSKQLNRKTEPTATDYFSIHCDHTICQFYDGNLLKIGFDKKPRILDMCFVNLHKKIYIVYIDADNKMIVIRDISKNSGLKIKKLPLEPNRLAKIDNNRIGVIYKKKFDILIFDINNMEEIITYTVSQGGITDSKSGIQGILALSETEFILSDKIHLYRCKLEKEKTDAVVTKFAPSVYEFDTARRLTHVTLSQNKWQDVIFIADENDKKLTSIDRKTGQLLYINDHEGQNRGLQNVRAIGATENRVYAATSAGISVFSHDQGYFVNFETNSNDSEDYRMLLDYKYHVEHTRSLCIHLDKGYIYVGLSCVIKQNDVIVIFRFKPNDTFE